MSGQLRSELLKLRTTRTMLGLMAGMLSLVAFIVIVQIASDSAAMLADEDRQRSILLAGGAASLFAVLVGAMAVTTEFRHGTIRPTLLYQPARQIVIGAKLAASVLAGAALGVLAEALALGIALPWLAGKGVDRALGGGELALAVAGVVAASALWAGIGVGIGALVRNQVAAIVGTIVWILVPEPLLSGLVPDVGRFTPGSAGQALSGATGESLLQPLPGGLVLTAYVLVLGAAGALLTDRRDVS